MGRIETGTATTYEEFNVLRDRLQELVSDVNDISQVLGVSEEYQDKLTRLRHLVTESMFRVIVVGGFSRGKSTLINALLGDKVLPAKMTPTTAVITVIKYGEQPRALVYFKDRDEPEEVSPENLREYLLIRRKDHKHGSYSSRIETPVERVELYYPLDLCKNGVEIVDSPGLEEDETRQKLTVRFLNECDAAIMVLSCLQLFSLQELKFVREELIGRGYDHIFYAVNYADHLTEDDELDIWERVREKIGNPDRTFIISARDALNGRLHGDEISLANSRFPSLEKALETFLVRDRGYVKLQSAQGMLDTYIDELGELTEIRLNLLERSKLEDLQKLEKQFEKSRVSISEKKEYIVMRIGQAGAHIGERLYNSFSRRCRSIAGNLPTLARELELEGSVFAQTEYREAVAAYLEDWIQREIRDWQESEAREILRTEGEQIQRLVESHVQGVLEEIDELKLKLAPEFRSASSSLATAGSGFERLLAAGGSLLLGDVGGVFTGGVFGLKGAILQLGGVTAANAVLWALGLLNPITGLMASGAVAYTLWRTMSPRALEELRVEIAQQLREAVGEMPDKAERQIKKNAMEHMEQLAMVVNDGIRAMLSNLERQLKSARTELERDKYGAIDMYKASLAELTLTKQKLALLLEKGVNESAAAEGN
jgi:GTPase SAR1 family protein